MKISKCLQEKLNNLPNNPGCYQYFNDNNKIIYVGKAKNLKKRVSSYFKKNNNLRIKSLVNSIKDLRIQITQNEKEALLLEYTWIKLFKPRYNVLLSDGKKYPYLVISNFPNPKLLSVRVLKKKYLFVYGPLPQGSSAFQIKNILNNLYPLKRCNKKINSKTPCSYYQINQCLGGCFKKVEKNLYLKNIRKIKKFLQGNDSDIKKILVNKMNLLAKSHQFEQAQKILLILQKLDFIISSQCKFITSNKNTDYINYLLINKLLVITIFCYRFHKLTFKKFKIHEILDQKKYQDIIATFLLQFYKQNIIPQRIIVNKDLKLNILAQVLKKRFLLPKLKEEKNVLALINKEAKEEIFKFKYNLNKVEFKELYLIKKLQKLTNLKKLPCYFEVYDIANLRTSSQVGGVNVYQNGIVQPSLFRHYNIDSNLKSDYERFKFVIKKRYANLKKITIPDLILVDGNIIQINAVKKALGKKLSSQIEILGLVKNNKHITNHIVNQENKTILINEQDLLVYLRLIQEKIHNFTISFHHLKQKKNMYQ